MNLLKEAIETLIENDEYEVDVLWVGIEGENRYMTWEEFKKIANFEYDDGFGWKEIKNLIIVGSNFWLERAEYDGSEWWAYKKRPKKPTKHFVFKKENICEE